MKQFITVAAFAVLAGVHALALAHQATSETYPDLVRKAQARSEAQDWAAAGPLWERVVEINPHEAWFWYALGTARLNARAYREAIPALEKARELGAGGLSFKPSYDIARAFGMLGDKENTLMWLERALDDGFRSRERMRTEEAFAFVKDDARFKALTIDVETQKMSRVEGWRHDLTFLETEMKRMHYAPFRNVSQADFEKEMQSLRDDVERLTDNQIIVRVMRLMARIGDGHTGCFPDMVSAWTQSVPLQFEIYPEGVYIIAADPSHANLVGERVLRFGDHTTEKVIQELNPLMSRDNTQGLLRSGRNLMRFPQALNGLGLLSESESIPLTVQDATGKERTVTVAAIANEPDFNRITAHPKWVTVYENAPGPVPVYLKDRSTYWWFEPLPDGKSVYFQFNSVSNGTDESLNDFVTRLFKYIDESKDVENLIIDLRWNNGGNSRLLPPLVNGLIRSKVNRDGNLFVIVGRYTYSAAMNAATFIERHTEATFVGEPTPSSPNFVGESNVVVLPYSRTGVSISDLYWQSAWPTDGRTWIAPFLYVPLSFEAYRSKRDPAMEAILEYQRDSGVRVP